MQSVAFVWVIGLEMLPHINSECSFINQSPFVYLKCILSMNYVCRITIVFSGIATEIFVGAIIETFCLLERCSWSKPMNRFPTVHCDLRLIQIEFCIVVQAQFFLFLKLQLVLSSLKKFRTSKLNNKNPELLSSWQTNRLRSLLKSWSINFSK